MMSKKILSILFTALLAGFALEQKVDCSNSDSTGSSWNDMLWSEAYGLHRIAVAAAGLGTYLYVMYKTPRQKFEAAKGEPVIVYLYSPVGIEKTDDNMTCYANQVRPKALVKKDRIMLAEAFPLEDGSFIPEGTVFRVGDYLDGSRVTANECITLIIDSIWDKIENVAEQEAIQNGQDYEERDENFMNTLETEVVATLKSLGYSVEQDSEGALIIDNYYKIGPFFTQGFLVSHV